MPKGKKKDQRGGRGRQNAHHQASDEDYDTGDTGSVVSSVADVESLMGDAPVVANGDAVDEEALENEYEDKIKDCIEGCQSKSAKTRLDSLTALRNGLSKKCMFEFILNRKITICDVLERCIKKGKGEEAGAAAMAATVLTLQLGGSMDDAEEVYTTLAPYMKVVLADDSAHAKSRAQCAEALGVMAFLTCDTVDSLELMALLENVFRASYWKGDSSPPSFPPQVTALHGSALMAWNLLLTIAPAHAATDIVPAHLLRVPEMLDSQDVDLRCTAGESIALMYDLARDEDEDFEGENTDELCVKLKQLATDSNKYRAKKDRRQQRANFRDILRGVEEGDSPSCHIRIGLMEALHINTWSTKRQYDSLCHVLGTGMSAHLQENLLVRDIFGLGAPLLDVTNQKASRNERHLYNSAAFKARTKARSKIRDKRSVAMHMQCA